MGALFAEGFDNNLGGQAEVLKIFSSSGSNVSVVAGGRFGGGRLSITSNDFVQKIIDPLAVLNRTEIFTGFSLFCANWAAFDYFLVGNVENNFHCRIQIDSGGFVAIKNANDSIVATSVAALPTSVWVYMEVRLLIGDPGGVCQIQVDQPPGSAVFFVEASGDFSAVGTATVRTLSWQFPGSNVTMDDVACVDTLGGQADTWLGDGRIYTLRPTADAVPNAWNANPGPNHFDAVNEVDGAVGEGDFLANSTPTNEERFDYANLPATAETVDFVFHTVRANKSDAGAAAIEQVIVSNGTEDVGPAQDMEITTSYYNHYVDVDPDTGLAWDIAGVNAIQGGLKIA